MTTETDYEFVRLSDANFTDLARLMDVVGRRPTDLAALHRKYDTAVFGGRYLGYLAYPRGQPQGQGHAVGYCGLFHMRARVAGKPVVLAQSGDNMVHPAHRGRGLFSVLCLKSYELAEAEGIDFMFGLPNVASTVGFNKNLGWHRGPRLVSINILTPTLPLSLLGRAIPALRRAHGKLLVRVLAAAFAPCPRQGAALSSVIASGADGVVRDDAFLEYKRDRVLALRSGNVNFFVKYDGDIAIGDIVDDGDGSQTRSLVRKLRLIGALMGVPRIKTYAAADSALVARLRGVGFAGDSLVFAYHDFTTGADLTKFQLTYLDYDTF